MEAAVAPEEALKIEEDLEAWHWDRSQQAPDLVACVAWYGLGRLMIQGWTKIPIDIRNKTSLGGERRALGQPWKTGKSVWRQSAGGFLQLAAYAPELTVSIIQGQLREKLDRLDELAGLPLAPHIDGYTPRQMTDDEILDGDDSWEQDHFDRPFALRQQLECFEWGMEKIRMFASISERSQEVGLPSRELYDALMEIDLNEVLRRLKIADVKLRTIPRASR